MTNTPRRSAVQSPDDVDPERTAAMEPVAPPEPGQRQEQQPSADGRARGTTSPSTAMGGTAATGATPPANRPLDGRFQPGLGRTAALVAEREEQVLGRSVAVASFRTYKGAADAVARLGGTGFPIEAITIVGSDLRLIEEVTGRMSLPRAATLGAISGAWFGALVSALVGIFAGSFGAFLALLLWGIVLGAVFGAGLGMLGYITYDRSRGFTSDRLVIAGRYDLNAPVELADRLRTDVLSIRPADATIIDGHPVR